MTAASRRQPRPASTAAKATIAGFELRLAGAPVALRRLLDDLWGNRSAAPRGRLNYTLERRPVGGVLRTPEGGIAFPSFSDPVHLHQLVLDDVFSRIGDAYALHGACVARRARGILISGPSGFGKTTLALHLALRGFDFLSDDLVLLDRRTGRLRPVRRGIHLRAGSRALLDARARARARKASRRRGREEWTVDPDRWLGPARRCGEVGAVFLLRPEADLHRVRRLHAYELAFAEGRRRLPAALTKLGHMKARRNSADGRHWRIEAEDPATIGAWIDGRPAGLRGWAKVAVTSPRFDGEPRATPIGRFQAAIELTQEMVNRGPGSLLGTAYEGREAELPVDLAAGLGGAHCFALVPGRLEETVRLVEDLLAGISPRPPARAGPR